MIFWKDFVLDEVIGPVIDPSLLDGVSDPVPTSCRRKRLGSPNVKDDVRGVSFQETGQEQRPARMVGLSSLDSESARDHMDVNRSDRAKFLRHQRGEA